MLEFIKTNHGNRPSVNESERMELDLLRKEVEMLKLEIKGNKNASLTSQLSTAEEDHSSDDTDEEFVDDLPDSVDNGPIMPRPSVSAEVFGKFHSRAEFVPPVHPKTPEQAEAIKTRMSSNFMFEFLNPKDKNSILEAVQSVKISKGDVIIQEGSDGDNFYLVESGKLNCTKLLNESDKEPTFLKEYHPGECFGELSLLYNAPRAATIACASDTCELWSLDRNTFNHIIKRAV